MITSLVVAAACLTCGTERWPVKTLSDPAAARLSYKPVSATIDALVRLMPPRFSTARVAPTEFTLYRVLGCLMGVKRERDSDYHLVITAPADRRATMIAEIPNRRCVGACRNVVNAGEYAAARNVVDGLTLPALVELTRFGFFDRWHGQTGVAPNSIELHPVLRVTPKGGCRE